MKKRPKRWPKSGWYWWLHHDQMVEWTNDIDERWEYVVNNKPKGELAVRLNAMAPVKGKLPVNFVKAWDAYYEVRAAYDKAWDAYYKARAACNKEWDTYKPEIEALHAIERPNVVYKNGCLVFKEGEK